MATSQANPTVDDTGADIAGTELDVRSSADMAQLDDLRRILILNEPVDDVVDEDPEQISREIVMQLLAATSDDELQAIGNAQGWRELIGVPVVLKGFRWRPSTFRTDDGKVQGSAVFFVVQGVNRETGEQLILTTGSRNVLAQLCNLAQRGTLVDSVWKLTELGKTRGGFTPLCLVKVDDN